MFTEENNSYWRAFSHSIHATFKERKYWYSAQAVFNYHGFEIVFDNYTHSTVSGKNSFESSVTRVYCKFKCTRPVHLKIVPATFINKISGLFDKNKILSSHPEFNSRFLVFSHNENMKGIIDKKATSEMIKGTTSYLFIDKKEGIWGKNLPESQYELSTYLDHYNIEYSELSKLKILFEELVDELIKRYGIIPAESLSVSENN